MPVTIQPLDLLNGQATVPSELRTAEWSRVPQWTRERSFWMAGVTESEVLEEMRTIVTQSASGEAGEFELRKQWEERLDDLGYEPEPGQEGTIKDLRSLRRFNIALRTNRALMNGWARKENGLQPGPVRAQPAYELVRFQDAKIPRDWEERFIAAGGALYEGRMIAAKTSDTWPLLGSVELFDDALGVDYPPFAWGSGMGWKLVGARECMQLGVMSAKQIRDQVDSVIPVVSSPNESLEMRPEFTQSPEAREALSEKLAGLAEWKDDVLLFTDPNGSRPMDYDSLERVWSQALPAEFHEVAPEGLFQRQSVLDFADDPEAFSDHPDRDQWDDLVRAVGRVTDAATRRRVMRAIADRSDPAWLKPLLSAPAWRAALEIPTLTTRAVAILRAVRSLF